MTTINELRAKAQKLAHEARDILSAADVTVEKTQEAERILAESDAIEARAANLEKIEARDRAYDAADRLPVESATVEERSQTDTRDRAFADYLRGDISDRELRAQSLTSTEGGYLVPAGFVANLITAAKAYGPMNEGGPVTYLVTASGNPLSIPTMDDTSNMGARVNENTDASDTDLVFGQKTLSAYKYTTGVVKISKELLQDSGIDIVAHVNAAMAERLGRKLNLDFTTGDGSGDPTGIVTGASAGVTAAAAAAITYDDLVALQHSVDPAYRANAGFMFNDATLKAIRLLKDSNGLPLWQPAMTAGAPATILGQPFYINQNVASMAASAKSVVYGDFSKFTVRRVRDFSLVALHERYATADQVGFVGFGRYDSIVTDSRAIKVLTQAAS